MASQYPTTLSQLELEKLDVERFVSEGGHDLAGAREMAKREANWIRTGQTTPPKAQFSINLEEEILDVIRHDANFQGISPQELVRWLLEKYAQGELTAKHFPSI